MSDPQFRGEVPAIADAIAQTRKREYLYSRYVQAQVTADLADDDNLSNALKAADRAWDDYAEECERLEQCTSPGCFARSVERAYCPLHDEYPPDYGD